MMQLLGRALLVACCLMFQPLWELTGAKPANLQRKHFVLGEHSPGETVLEIIAADADWYEGHAVQLDVLYPSTASGGEQFHLSCVEVVITYAPPENPEIPDGPTTEDVAVPRVQFASGGLGQSHAGVSIFSPAATFFQHSTVFYGLR